MHLADHRFAIDVLREPEDAVGNREDRIRVGFGLQIFADKKRRRLPHRKPHSELLHEALQLGLAPLRALRGHRGRAERVDEDKRRIVRLDLLDDARQHAFEIAGQNLRRQIHEADGAVDLFGVEERELLLIAQHLHRRLAEAGEE